MSISYNQVNTRGRYAGAIEYSFATPRGGLVSAIVGGKAKQVSTITVDSAVNDATYTITVAGETLTYTADGSATVNEIAVGLRDALNANATAGANVVASASGADLTLTSLVSGVSFTVSESDSNLSLATTQSANTGDTIPYGVGVYRDPAITAPTFEALLPDTAVFTNQVLTFTPVAANDTEYTITLNIDGSTYHASFTSDGSATAAEIVTGLIAAVNGAVPANTVLAAGTTTLTLTSEVDGLRFTATGEGGTMATTTAEVGGLDFMGVSTRQHKEPDDNDGNATYSAGEALSIIKRGFIYVLFEGSDPTIGSDDVFVRVTASGSEQAGAFRASADAADCAPLPAGRARWAGVSETGLDGQTICLLELL